MPRRPLARTYRPQRFAEVLGQEAPVRALAAASARRELAAAYIFSGTRGIGKTTIARIFAKALNCEKGPAEDCCDACPACRDIAEGRSLDVLEMDAATHTGIDDVRELREAAQYPPSRKGRYRVFIIDEAHQLSQAAWNGLLKILEEPPPWCVFLLCTTEPHKIPATIESRALHFAFKSPSTAEIREHLARIAEREGLEPTGEALDLLAKAAQGSVRDGLSALDQVRALAGKAIDGAAVREALGLVPEEAVRDYVRAVGRGDAAAALAVLDGVEREGHDLRGFAAEALERVRALALAKAVGSRPGAPPIAPDELESFRVEQLVWLGKVLDETEARLRQGGPQRVLLDLATIRMTAMADLTPLEELAQRIGSGPAGRQAPPAPPGPAPASPRRRGGSPGPSAPASPPPKRSAPQAPPDDASLLPRLAEAAAAITGRVGSFLRQAKSARLEADGRLVISIARSRAFWKTRLETPAAREAIVKAAAEVLGGAPPSVEFRLEGETAEPGAARPRNRDALERASRDPIVRELFERFDAVLLGGEALPGPEGPPAPDGPAPEAPR
ncbi:MAG: DNA polymerase III subunit gamma/tau [Acidobacteria bacterium]|nr:MAG: DNA polymerase III subunit gamma/tau [Acidobacteriota bacterium]